MSSERHGPGSTSFRLLESADLPLMHRWLNTPHVLEWWDKPGPSPEEVREKYFARIEKPDPTRCYVILRANRPIGFIQEYAIRDHPDYAKQVQVEEGAAGIDLFIGEPEFVHRGLGAQIIRQFLQDVVFQDPSITSCVIGPSDKNRSAIRAYEKAGFRYLKTVQVEGEDDPEFLMQLTKTELLRQSP